jgi:hypothetical protein
VAPDGFSSFVRVLKAESFHFLRRGFLLAASIIHDEKYKTSSITILHAFGLDFVYYELHPPALHAIDAPRRMIQKMGDAAQMTILPGRVANLRNVLPPGTKNDAVN